MNNFVIVTPNLNMAGYLPETIESVLSNLRPGDQYFIIDGASNDGSVEIIKKYEKYITGWLSEQDTCYADALKKGFALGSREYQCWINSGDLLLPNALEAARETLDEDSVDFIFGDDLHIDEKGKVLNVSTGKVNSLRMIMAIGGWTPLQDACFWKANLYNKVGGLNSNKKYAADYDLFLRMSLLGNCKYTPNLYSAFRRHEGQTSHKHKIQYEIERYQSRNEAIKKLNLNFVTLYLCKIYFWIYLRVRGRLFSTNKKLKSLKGRKVSDILCQPSF